MNTWIKIVFVNQNTQFNISTRYVWSGVIFFRPVSGLFNNYKRYANNKASSEYLDYLLSLWRSRPVDDSARSTEDRFVDSNLMGFHHHVSWRIKHVIVSVLKVSNGRYRCLLVFNTNAIWQACRQPLAKFQNAGSILTTNILDSKLPNS